jgi:Domain of unknown function (DUF4266)
MRTFAVLCLILLAACATVRPWERERLAAPTLQFVVDPDADEQEASILEITEGSTFGGGGSAGAGCGCH